MSPEGVRSGFRTHSTPQAQRIAAEFRALELRDQVADLARELARLRGAALDVLHALPEDKGEALKRLRLEMAGRGQHRERVA